MTVEVEPASTPDIPDRPPTAAPPPRRRRRRWLAVVALVVTVLVLAAAVDEAVAATGAWHSAEAALTSVDAQRGRVGHHLEVTDGQLGKADALQRTRRTAQSQTAAAIGSASEQLAAASQTRGLQELDIATLQDCLDGVSSAATAVGGGNLSGAVGALTSASSACLALDASNGQPIYPFDFPDPFILVVGSQFYAFATNSAAGNIQIITSSDLVTWTTVGNALPAEPAWATTGSTWAPAVLQRGSTFVLYYTTQVAATKQQCISVAVATQPQGPYVDSSSAPLECQGALGGSIDPTPFVDTDGTPYLIWKSEGAGGQPPMLWSEQLTPDGTAFAPAAATPPATTPPASAPATTPAPPASAPAAAPAPTPLLAPSQAWQAGVIEAPTMAQIDGHDVLFYSGNQWGTTSYAVGYAECAGPLGPCTDASPQPLLASTSGFLGPGGESVFVDAQGRWWMAFHAWLPGKVGYPNSRLLYLRPLTWDGDVPEVGP